MRFLSTWSTWREESNLPTYHDRNNWGKASDERAARAVFNGSGDSVWRCSGSKGFFGSGGVGGGSSSMWWIGAGVSGAVARWQRHSSSVTARVRLKSAWDRALLIGILHRIEDCKNLNTFLAWIELYLTMIRKKSRRGQNQVGYDIGNRFFWPD
jgi:hypothetical protein